MNSHVLRPVIVALCFASAVIIIVGSLLPWVSVYTSFVWRTTYDGTRNAFELHSLTSDWRYAATGWLLLVSAALMSVAGGFEVSRATFRFGRRVSLVCAATGSLTALGVVAMSGTSNRSIDIVQFIGGGVGVTAGPGRPLTLAGACIGIVACLVISFFGFRQETQPTVSEVELMHGS